MKSNDNAPAGFSSDLDTPDEAALAKDNAKKEQDEKDAELVSTIKKIFAVDEQHWNPIYDKGRDDLDFLSDEPGAQWPETEYKNRTDAGRPTLTIDQLSQFVHQVANNIRMNTPSINPIPAGGGSSVKTAKILKGLIKKIEYDSKADIVYDTGSNSAIKCGIGYALVDHDYVDDDTFDQELKIIRVTNPFVIFPDSNFKEVDGSDQEHGTILHKMKVREFKAEYPDADVCSFSGTDDVDGTNYSDEDEVTVAEFFQRETSDEEITMTNQRGEEVKRTRKKYVIRRYRLSNTQILKRTTFPGSFIPIVPFLGEEAWNDGKRNLFSLIRKSKESQYMFNLSESTKAEVLDKQPLAPVMTPAGAIENYADDWKNPGKTMALRYDVTDAEGNPLPKPERLMPPQISAGFAQQSIDSVNNIRSSMGMYQNSLGMQGQETSGKAIDARKIQGDIASYHFPDNTVIAICQLGRICVFAAPEIYDTARVLSIITDEDKIEEVGINGERVDGQEEDHLLNQGKYNVRVITGSSFTTIRQESAAFYQDLIKGNPELLEVFGDIMFENMDVAGAAAAAARIKKVMDPKLLQDENQEQDPEKMQLQATIEQLQQALQAAEQQINDKNQGIMVKAEIDKEKNQISLLTAQSNAQAKKFDALIKVMQLKQNARSLDITEQKNAGDLALKSGGLEIDQLLAAIDVISAQTETTETELPAGDMSANDGGIQ